MVSLSPVFAPPPPPLCVVRDAPIGFPGIPDDASVSFYGCQPFKCDIHLFSPPSDSFVEKVNAAGLTITSPTTTNEEAQDFENDAIWK